MTEWVTLSGWKSDPENNGVRCMQRASFRRSVWNHRSMGAHSPPHVLQPMSLLGENHRIGFPEIMATERAALFPRDSLRERTTERLPPSSITNPKMPSSSLLSLSPQDSPSHRFPERWFPMRAGGSERRGKTLGLLLSKQRGSGGGNAKGIRDSLDAGFLGVGLPDPPFLL